MGSLKGGALALAITAFWGWVTLPWNCPMHVFSNILGFQISYASFTLVPVVTTKNHSRHYRIVPRGEGPNHHL